MLTETEKQLITAAVDGELSHQQEQAFHALMARSAAAATLHAALLADRDAVRRLPRPAAPSSLQAAVLSRLPQAVPVRPRPAPHRRRNLAPIGMAASFLLAVGAGAYWLASPAAGHRLATKQLQQLPKDDLGFAPTERPIPPSDDHPDEPFGPDLPPSVDPPMPPAVAIHDGPPSPPDAAPPETRNGILAAAVGSDVKAFERVDVKLPLLLPFADFASDSSQKILTDRLTRDPATRIDLFVKDSARAVDQLTQAGRAVNLNVITETIAGERMKRKMPSVWLLYTDALTPAEVTKWLATAAGNEGKASGSAGAFAMAHVLPAGPTEQKEAHHLLDVDLGLSKKSADATPNGHISEKTLDQVATAMQKGDAPKPAILLTYLPPLVRVHPALSKDVKQYHELRRDRKPGTGALMIVIRPTAN